LPVEIASGKLAAVMNDVLPAKIIVDNLVRLHVYLRMETD
jgi:hypothetical protein